MNTLLEALRLLKEDKEINNYPTKCRTYAYKVIVNGNRLLCGSFVLPRNLNYPELGVNITTPYYGPGTQADTRNTLEFLTNQDAEAFCAKYNFKSCRVYISRVYTTLVRIDNNTNIPTYMSIEGMRRYPNSSRLNTTQLYNYNSEIQSVNDIISSELKQKNIAAEKKYNKALELSKVSDEIVNYINNLPESVSTQTTAVGPIQIKFKLYSNTGENVSKPPLDPQFNLIANISGKFFDEIVENKLLETPKLPADMVEVIINIITKKYKDKYKLVRYNNKSIIFDLYGYGNVLVHRVVTYIALEDNFELAKMYNKPADIEIIKQTIKNSLIKNASLIAQDINTGIEQLEDIKKNLSEIGADKKVELTYDDFAE